VRIILAARAEESDESAEILKNLVARGCSYEGANGLYMAVNIPPTTDFVAVCRYLTDAQVQWEHADPRWEDLQASANGTENDDAG
jgi:hypothetical protein